MSRYGIDYYGQSYYGADSYVTFDASPFTAKAYGYGQILLDWVSPTGDWGKIRLVRNTYGFPVSPFDGTTLLSVFREDDPTTFTDTFGLSEGAFYYYSLFVYETDQYSWVRAGNAIGLSVKQHKNGEKMYQYLPEAYKLEKIYVVDTSINNQPLARFLNLFGFELDYLQTLADLLVYRYNIQKVGGTLIPIMLKQFGLTYEPEIGLQQSRVLVRDAIHLYEEKGSTDGLKEYIKAFTGYALSAISNAPNPAANGVVTGHNLMLDYNDSSFEESIGHWESVTNAGLYQLKTKTITKASLTSNVATLTIGSHNYRAGNKVYIQDIPIPLFSSPSVAKTITAVTSTTISYALTAADVSQRSTSGTVVPVPEPREETTASVLYPNKQNGVLSVTNSSASSGTVAFACGISAPITKGIPVTATEDYTFSIYSTAGTSTRTITLNIKWYDRRGILLSTTTGSGVANTTTEWATRLTVSGVAPANAYYAVPGVSIASVAGSASNEYHYFDCAQFENSASATDFDEARQIHFTLKATRINELLNPHFASPFTPWSATDAVLSVDVTTPEPESDIYNVSTKELTSNVATIGLDGTHILKVGESAVVDIGDTTFDGTHIITAVTLTTFSYSKTASNVSQTNATGTVFKSGNALRATATGSSVLIKSTTTTADLMPIHYPGTLYTFSVYIMTDIGPEYVDISIAWYDSAKTYIGSSSSGSEEVTTEWNRIDVTGTAPSSAAYAHVEIDWPVSVSNLIQMDSALFENSPFVLEYFDGSGGPGYSNDFLWEGNVLNGARSHFYKNRLATQLRLNDELTKAVTLGTTFAVYLAQPKT